MSQTDTKSIHHVPTKKQNFTHATAVKTAEWSLGVQHTVRVARLPLLHPIVVTADSPNKRQFSRTRTRYPCIHYKNVRLSVASAKRIFFFCSTSKNSSLHLLLYTLHTHKSYLAVVLFLPKLMSYNFTVSAMPSKALGVFVGLFDFGISL